MKYEEDPVIVKDQDSGSDRPESNPSDTESDSDSSAQNDRDSESDCESETTESNSTDLFGAFTGNGMMFRVNDVGGPPDAVGSEESSSDGSWLGGWVGKGKEPEPASSGSETKVLESFDAPPVSSFDSDPENCKHVGGSEEGNAPSSGSRAANASQATGQSGKQKAVMTEPEDNESSADDDDSQTVRHRSLRHTEEGSSAAGEGTYASQAQAPTIVNNSPPPAGAANNAQLALIPVQIIDDSSPEAEDRVPLPDAPHEEPSDIPVLEQIAPDSIPVPSEANPEAMPAVVEREPPAEEVFPLTN
ncbi:uncharacterized protein LOC133711657 [Rosa rugosa]|uniref:uncharacterized protein LOC133711657 n=1 Tax=Rosa rugosa TaxID=74645 RepID=UPI002B408938|nr:uncharacterized protein LOC133711657 [Rosa rugosa]